MINRRGGTRDSRSEGVLEKNDARRAPLTPRTSEPPKGWRRVLPHFEDLVIFGLFFGIVYLFYDVMHIKTHGPEDFASMRKAGQLAARTLAHVEPHVVPGATTAALDDVIREFISRNDAVAATLGYRGFAHSSCVSVNEVVCHGVPSREKRLHPGDIVNVDVTIVVDGWHGDTSKTFIVGGEGAASANALKLVQTTREALRLGLAGCASGGRMGDVVYPIQKHLEAAGFSVVNAYTAHGIGRRFHAPPHIKHGGGLPGQGALLKPGMFFTVEPMANEGTDGTRVLRDGWTVVTADGKLSAQFEHTVGVGEHGCEVFTRVPGSDAFI